MEKKRRSRTVTITFLKGFEEEHKYVSKLKGKGINRSFWICQAVREKISRDETRDNLIEDLEYRINALEKKIAERPAILYMPAQGPGSSADVDVDKETERKLAEVAATSFDF